ncbi:pol polyprotein [Apostichopus japonicus]|uniref:Pol polyprotein n=1 Tax=Stichopus japonicus TaxID=307972 RepID=A0A2G8JR54_STIJA|nr:pol polyprotein [Apostichopus japonicus]
MADLLIAGSSLEEHYDHLRQLFKRLQEHGIVINPSKNVFGVSSLDFVGHHVDASGITLFTDKVKAVTDFPPADTLRKLREFIGLVNFYKRFIPNCAIIIQPLADLLRTNLENMLANLTDIQLQAFSNVKASIAQSTLLNHLNPIAQLCQMVDASDVAVCGVLQQSVGDN